MSDETRISGNVLLADGGRVPTPAENEAAAAVRRAEKRARSASSDTTGHFHGKCRDCGATFDFDYGDDQHMAPCPECGSNDWHRESDDAE